MPFLKPHRQGSPDSDNGQGYKRNGGSPSRPLPVEEEGFPLPTFPGNRWEKPRQPFREPSRKPPSPLFERGSWPDGSSTVVQGGYSQWPFLKNGATV